MVGALLYLRLQSLRNLILYRIRRLRQPKYLIGTAAAVAYLYMVLARPAVRSVASATSAAGFQTAGIGASVICASMAVAAVVRIAFAWIAPADKPGLRFSEAEIGFLFPAPISRRTLIHFRLLSAQVTLFFTAILMAFFLRRTGPAGISPVLLAVAWWIALSTFDLHLTGTNLFLSRLRETSPRFALWRITGVVGISLYAVAVGACVAAFVGAAAHRLGEPGFDPVASLAAYAPIHWLVLPFRIVFGPYFAATPAAFALALVPALALLALHYLWVCNSEARFEEGSISLAEKRAAAKAAALQGELPKMGRSKPRPRSGPFRLSSSGPPEIAFLWKNLLSMHGSLLSRRLLFIAVGIIAGMSFSLGPVLSWKARASGFDAYGPMIVGFSAIIAAYALILGPQIARQDLRTDLPNMDLLKTYPMEGWRIVLGELLAPTAVLTLVLWFAILASSLSADSQGKLEWLTPGVRSTIAACLAAAAPVLCMIQLIVPNAIMLLLPGWYQSSRSRAGGIEMFGQRLIFAVLQLVIALVVAAPAVAIAALVIFSSKWVVGVGPAWMLAAVAVIPILVGEAAVGLWWLGERFNKFDLSLERT